MRPYGSLKFFDARFQNFRDPYDLKFGVPWQNVFSTWAYGAQIWGCAARSNLEILQRFQNRALRQIVGARWYERNSDIHRDLGMETVSQFITKVATNYEKRLHHHPNIEAIQLLDNSNEYRRLKRVKPWELASPSVWTINFNSVYVCNM